MFQVDFPADQWLRHWVIAWLKRLAISGFKAAIAPITFIVRCAPTGLGIPVHIDIGQSVDDIAVFIDVLKQWSIRGLPDVQVTDAFHVTFLITIPYRCDIGIETPRQVVALR